MDQVMNQCWQSGQPPFDGDCLLTPDGLSLEDLRRILLAVIAELERSFASKALYTFDDWHQHDGYVTERREATGRLWQNSHKVQNR
jgi:hypothetical protein